MTPCKIYLPESRQTSDFWTPLWGLDICEQMWISYHTTCPPQPNKIIDPSGFFSSFNSLPKETPPKSLACDEHGTALQGSLGRVELGGPVQRRLQLPHAQGQRRLEATRAARAGGNVLSVRKRLLALRDWLQERNYKEGCIIL